MHSYTYIHTYTHTHTHKYLIYTDKHSYFLLLDPVDSLKNIHLRTATSKKSVLKHFPYGVLSVQ